MSACASAAGFHRDDQPALAVPHELGVATCIVTTISSSAATASITAFEALLRVRTTRPPSAGEHRRNVGAAPEEERA